MNWQKTKAITKNILYGTGLYLLASGFGGKAPLAERTAEKEFAARQNSVGKLDLSGKEFSKPIAQQKGGLLQNPVDSGGVQYEDRNIHIVARGTEAIIEGMGLDAFGPNFTFDYTWRTQTMIVPNVDIATSKVHIQGEAVVMVGTGKQGLFIIFADMELKQFVMATMKQNLVIKGDWEQRYHRQEEGISDPVVIAMNEHGIAWPNRKGDGFYEINYVPLPAPKFITFSSDAAGPTTDWTIASDGKTVVLKDSKDVLASAIIKNDVGDSFTRKESRIKWNGVPRSDEYELRIENQKPSVSLGKNFALTVSPEIVDEKGFETVEMGDERRPTYRVGTVQADDSTFLVRLVPTRSGIWAVLVPQAGNSGRLFNLEEGKPLNNSEIDRVLDFVVASDRISGMAGWIRGDPKSDRDYTLVAYHPDLGLKVEADLLKKLSAGDISVKGNRVAAYESGEEEAYIIISDLKVRSMKQDY